MLKTQGNIKVTICFSTELASGNPTKIKIKYIYRILSKQYSQHLPHTASLLLVFLLLLLLPLQMIHVMQHRLPDSGQPPSRLFGASRFFFSKLPIPFFHLFHKITKLHSCCFFSLITNILKLVNKTSRENSIKKATIPNIFYFLSTNYFLS